jgi:putative ABC transport system permease protein
MFAIPLAWLQLQREKIRLLVALAGISFAVILMFIQMGFQQALLESAVAFHQSLKGDIFLVSTQSTALVAMKSFSDRRLYPALGVEAVEDVSPMYLGLGIWKNPFWQGPPKSQTRSILVIGIDPTDQVLNVVGLTPENQNQLRQNDVVLFDRKSRDEFGPIAERFPAAQATNTPIQAELENRRLEVGGLFELGASFGADGNLITSDTTFRRIFTQRQLGQIDVGIIRLKPGADLGAALDALKQTLPGELRINPKLSAQEARENFIKGDIRVLSRQAFVNMERKYWEEGTAIGFIFGLGTAIGFVVGIVIVYQILYTDVTDHLAEYATLKAMGYRNQYLLKVVFQQALLLAVMGYIPGYLLSTGMYKLTRNATALPIDMTPERGIVVLILTIVMCMVSGAIAVRKVSDADPADIF